MFGNSPDASETFLSLNEIVQSGRERLETTRFTEQYSSLDGVGRQRPKVKTTHEIRHVQLGPPRGAATSDPHEEGRPLRREETFQSTTTTLVGSSRTSIAEGIVGRGVPTIVIGDTGSVDEDSDQDDFDLYAMSPILGEYISSTTFYGTGLHGH